MTDNEKEKRKEAVALGYDGEKFEAPKLLAKGKGLVAQEILERAESNQIPIQKDASLVELLSKLNINETIPDELYQAVAEVFAFIYKTNQAAKRK